MISFIGLPAQQPRLEPQIEELEVRLDHYVDAKFCITICANGTDALKIAQVKY